MKVYEQDLHIEGDSFVAMRTDADLILQKLIKNMCEKDAMKGSLTIKIDVELKTEYIANYDPSIKGESRKSVKPEFTHKICSMMQIKGEAKGGTKYDGMEIVYDEKTGEYVLRPIVNTEQRSFFDADFEMENEEGDIVEEERQDLIEGQNLAGLPGPAMEDSGYNYEDPEE